MARKVRIKFPNYNQGEEYQVGSFIRLKGENFFRRVNSDGTLTEVGEAVGKYNPTPAQRNLIARTHQQNMKRTGFLRKQVIKHALQSTEGDASSGKFGTFINFILPGTYTGVFSSGYGGMNNYQTSMFTKGAWGKDRNLVHTYSTGSPDYMEDSDIGVGRYKGTEWEQLPAYKGNFYGDVIYLPEDMRQDFNNNTGNSFSLDKDVYVQALGNRPFGGTDDVRNHYVTIENNGSPTVLFEDVWNLDHDLDQEAFPFILNQRVPVQFVEKSDPRLKGAQGIIYLGFNKYFKNKNATQ